MDGFLLILGSLPVSGLFVFSGSFSKYGFLIFDGSLAMDGFLLKLGSLPFTGFLLPCDLIIPPAFLGHNGSVASTKYGFWVQGVNRKSGYFSSRVPVIGQEMLHYCS